jgi:2-polyprenyl-3-methyl-5-hydroxy-6-metoxy-1,4-benzoquinol methylase
MVKKMSKTSERLVPDKMQKTVNDHVMYLRHVFAYEYAKKLIVRDSSILDMGFGEGYGTANLSSYFKNVFGLEVAENAVQHAIKQYQSENCRYRIYDGREVPFENESFDGVTSFQVIEHVIDSVGYVREAWRVLKTGGILILTTPNRALRLKAGQKPWNRFHLREYAALELQTLLNRTFHEVKIYGIYGNEKLQEMELARIKTAKIVARIDIFGIRDMVPMKMRQAISNIIHNIKSPSTSEENIVQFGVEDFHVSESAEGGMDLLAVCKK